MNKIALCLSGVAGHGSTMRFRSTSSSFGYLAGLESIKKNVIESNGGLDCVDVFIHSWDPELQEEMQNAYSAKSILCEYPIYPNFKHDFPQGIYDENRVQRTYSRWYSQKHSNILKEEYETKNGFKYDWVISSRFDIEYITPINLKELNNNKFYTSWWEVSSGHMDVYYISNSDIMNKFNYLYDYLGEYYKPTSELVQRYKDSTHWSSRSSELVSNHVISKWHLSSIGHEDKQDFFGKEKINWRIP